MDGCAKTLFDVQLEAFLFVSHNDTDILSRLEFPQHLITWNDSAAMTPLKSVLARSSLSNVMLCHPLSWFSW